MANCVTCKANCERAGQHRVKTDCVSYVPKDYPKPRTNADHLRAMTDEELARFTTSIQADVLEKAGKAIGYPGTLVKDSDIEDSEIRWLDWLKQEAQE